MDFVRILGVSASSLGLLLDFLLSSRVFKYLMEVMLSYKQYFMEAFFVVSATSAN